MNIDPVEFFSATVPESHSKFLDACEAAGVSAQTFKHPLTGPIGEPLYAAACRIGPDDATNVLFCISGTHGIEGYAGSGLQIGALLNKDETLALDARTAVVMLHMINPWGAAWNRKENEDNQELLRHFYYCHHPRPPNPIFLKFHEIMGLDNCQTIDEYFAARINIKCLYEKYSPEEVARALASGQGTHPQAITFNGGEPAWSKFVLDSVINANLQGTEHIVVLDLHTAMGEWGRTILMCCEPDGSTTRQQFLSWVDGDVWPAEEGIRFYDFIEDMIPGSEVIATILECGTETLGSKEQYIFSLDTWLHFHSNRLAPENAEYVSRYRRFFYPETNEWKRSIWAHGQNRWQQYLAGLRSWTSSK